MAQRTINKKNVALHLLAALLALTFLLAGSFKLSGAEQMVDNFNRFGLPIWMLYFTGALEVASALLMAWPSVVTRFVAALLLSGAMLGAALVHVIVDGVGQSVPALVLLALTSVQLYANRSAITGLPSQRPDAPQTDLS